jgi:hypothetical protein
MKLGSLLVALTLLQGGAVLAHGGGLNAEGCHNNRRTGDYHCHRAPAAAPAVAPQGTSQGAPAGHRALAAQPSTTANPSLPPGCYVGPRGGTYTITKSGRKNYSGC